MNMSFRRWPFVVGCLVALLPIGARATAPGCAPSRFRSTSVRIIAHASGDYFGPPNSIEMMRAARRAGADILDADVRVTADGILVASHDDRVPVTETSTVSIARTSYADLLKIDLGQTWTGPGGVRPLAGKKVRVPTIESVLRAFPNNRVGLEFKTTGGEATMCRLLRTLRRTDDVFISSAGDAAVDRFKPLCPEVATTVTDAMVLEFEAVKARNVPWCAPVPIGQPPLREGTFRLDRAGVGWDHAHGLAVFTWTADDRRSLDYVASLGVDGVYTARPDIARLVFRGK